MPEVEVWVNQLVPLRTSLQSLNYSSLMAIRADTVYVVDVRATVFSADFKTPNNVDDNLALTGDNVYIYVNFSYPIAVSAASKNDITLEIKLSGYSYAYNASGTRAVYPTMNYTQKVPYDSYSDDVMTFIFHVFPGAGYTNATVLDYSGVDALELHNGATIKQASLYPTTDVNLTLPGVDGRSFSMNGLHDEMIYINGSNAPELTSIHSDHSNGSYGAGEEITIFLTFSSFVSLVNYTTMSDPNITLPSIRFYDPAGARAIYDKEQTTNKVIAFKYTVRDGDYASPLLFSHPESITNDTDWHIKLNDANFTDNIGNIWTRIEGNRTIDMTEFNKVTIDTAAPVITDITTSSPDGTYNPGEESGYHLTFRQSRSDSLRHR